MQACKLFRSTNLQSSQIIITHDMQHMQVSFQLDATQDGAILLALHLWQPQSYLIGNYKNNIILNILKFFREP